MKNKKIILFIVFALFLGCNKDNNSSNKQESITKNAKNDELVVIGQYYEAVTSMCAQNCVNYKLGNISLTEPIKEEKSVNSHNQNNNPRNYLAKGEMIEVEEELTIAGPSEDQSYENNSLGEKIKKQKFKIRDYEFINFYEIDIKEEELKKFVNNQDSVFNIHLNNPIDRDLNLEISIDDYNDKVNIYNKTLPANGDLDFDYIYKKGDNNQNKKRLETETLFINIEDTNENDNIMVDIKNTQIAPWE